MGGWLRTAIVQNHKDVETELPLRRLQDSLIDEQLRAITEL